MKMVSGNRCYTHCLPPQLPQLAQEQLRFLLALSEQRLHYQAAAAEQAAMTAEEPVEQAAKVHYYHQQLTLIHLQH
jgi:hypothetical protein